MLFNTALFAIVIAAINAAMTGNSVYFVMSLMAALPLALIAVGLNRVPAWVSRVVPF